MTNEKKHNHGIFDDCGAGCPPDSFIEEKKFSKQEILDLLPEETEYNNLDNEYESGIKEGWDQCRQAVIDALEKR